MTNIQIEFLIGLYFVVLDSPAVFSQPLTIVGLIRFILGVVLILLAYFGVSIIH